MVYLFKKNKYDQETFKPHTLMYVGKKT